MENKFPSEREFREWLAEKPADWLVSSHWGTRNCPLAVFLVSSGAASNPYVRPDAVREGSCWHADYNAVVFAMPSGAREKPSLPEWANVFALRIDELGNVRFIKGGERAVTAGDCLRVLIGE